jgi:GNAT superfamily N-acetyltransferase
MTTRVSKLDPAAADDPSLVARIAGLVNAAYAAGEAGLWLPGWKRTTEAEVHSLVADGGMLIATAADRVVGCAHMHDLDAATADLGFISTALDHWGGGTGGALVAFAEDLARDRGVRAMQLELLVPRDGRHPAKERLRAWYERLGYAVVRRAPFDEISRQTSHLAAPCEFLVFRKPLAP